MIVVLRFIGLQTNKVVEEIAKMGFRINESSVVSCWEDWNVNRMKVGRKRQKYESNFEMRGKERLSLVYQD